MKKDFLKEYDLYINDGENFINLGKLDISNKIEQIALVYDFDSKKFVEKLYNRIKSMEDCRLDVEIKYTTNIENENPLFTALIIGRTEKI